MPSTVRNHDSARRILQQWSRQVTLLRGACTRSWLFTLAGLSLAGLLCAIARAQGDFSSNTSSVVAQGSVSACPLRVPVGPGDDIIFRELSDVKGLSQTRVLQIVQYN